MNLKKIGLILTIPLTFILTGCGDVYTDVDVELSYLNSKHIVTGVKFVKNGAQRNITLYNFADETVDIYVDNIHQKQISIQFNIDAQYAHHISAYKRIFNEQIIQYGCKHVYGCQAEKKKIDDLVTGFKQQIEVLQASSSQLETELETLTAREAQLAEKLALAKSAEQKNVQTINILTDELAGASAQKLIVSDNLDQLQKLAKSVLTPKAIGGK